MPSAYCPSCGATYHCATTGPNGPVCRYCIATGEIVVLLAVTRQRLTERPLRRRADPRRAAEPGVPERPKSHRG